MSTHTLETELQVKLWQGMAPGEYDTAHPKVRISYDYTRGHPAYTPKGEYAPIDPPEPAECRLIAVVMLDGDGCNPTPDQLWDLAEEWINDEGHAIAVETAEQDVAERLAESPPWEE